jgi:glycosyltransferase involved in cell wall biosynthesis
VSRKSLHIAWIGFAPAEESGGVPGVAIDLLHGLASLGHRVDCYFPSRRRQLPPRIADLDNLTPVWGTNTWRANRWYSRTKRTASVSSRLATSLSSLRLRKEFTRRHRREPYDLIYQFSGAGNPVPPLLRRDLPLVVHPETSSAGELKFLIKERRLSFRCQPAYVFGIAAIVLWRRTLVQRRRIRRVDLIICISSVFRDHLIRDYGVSREATVVVPNPVRLDRFEVIDRPLGTPPTVLVLGRIAARKGVDDVVAVARWFFEHEIDVRFRVVGGASLWSDYTPLLADLPAANSEYVGRVHSARVPAELAGSDVLLQASKWEPFALTVGEALAAGVPVVATSEVGAIEEVDRSVGAAPEPGDVEALAAAIVAMLDRLRADPAATRSLARAEAERLFAPDVVCAQISTALEALADGQPVTGDARAGDAAVTSAPASTTDALARSSS